jgi:hypothetical protein
MGLLKNPTSSVLATLSYSRTRLHVPRAKAAVALLDGNF